MLFLGFTTKRAMVSPRRSVMDSSWRVWRLPRPRSLPAAIVAEVEADAQGRRRRAGAAGGGAAGGGAGTVHHLKNQSDLTTCQPGMVWDTKQQKCLARHSGVLPDPELTEYAYALAKADRYQEAHRRARPLG